ncbi:MAG: hypothetical protein H0W42_06465 [Gemmatimonadaceae bacterium]|nr:hypothetical protein [Gemmatimonadaceae bacterium]
MLASVGCAGAAPGPETRVEPDEGPAPIAREAPRPVTSAVRASFEHAPGTSSYVVTSEATIAEIDSAVSVPRTFRQVARVELAVVPAAGYTVVTTRGSVEDANAKTMIHTAVDTLHAKSMDAAAEPGMPICGRDTVPPVHLGTLLPPVPRELREGLRWQRRQIYASCQGPIPIRVERVDSYTVAGRAPQVVGSGVTLSRSSSLAYTGSGVEGQHNMRISGSGSAQATLILDASAGRLISAMEESMSEIDITASGRTRQFSQRVTRTVNRQ